MSRHIFKHSIRCSVVLPAVFVLHCGLPTSVRQNAKPSPEQARIARFEKQVDELREKLKIPSLSAAIVKDQKLTFIRDDAGQTTALEAIIWGQRLRARKIK